MLVDGISHRLLLVEAQPVTPPCELVEGGLLVALARRSMQCFSISIFFILYSF